MMQRCSERCRLSQIESSLFIVTLVSVCQCGRKNLCEKFWKKNIGERMGLIRCEGGESELSLERSRPFITSFCDMILSICVSSLSNNFSLFLAFYKIKLRDARQDDSLTSNKCAVDCIMLIVAFHGTHNGMLQCECNDGASLCSWMSGNALILLPYYWRRLSGV